MDPKLKHLAHSQDYWTLYKTMVEQHQLNNPQVQRELAYIRGFRDFRFFVSWFFPHYCKQGFSRMHQDFFDVASEPERRGCREVIAAPRGHAKTSMKVIFKVLHSILYETDQYVLIICQSEAEAKDRVTQILNELSTNQRIIDVYGAVYRETVKSGLKKSFVTDNGIKVQAKSIGQQVRGLNFKGSRPTLVILDDVETLVGVQSLEQRIKMKDWFYKDVMKVGQTDGTTNFTVIGTCLHIDSLLSHLLESPGWETYRYQAVESFSIRQDLWDEWRSLYTNLTDPNRMENADRFYQCHEADMLSGTQVLWPEGESYLALMKQRVIEGEAAFNSEKQNRPYDPDMQLFNMETAQYFTFIPDKEVIQWQDEPNRQIPVYNLKSIIAYHDPALGRQPGKAGDFGAIVVVGQDPHGFMYVLDCYLAKSEPSAQIAAAFELHKKWKLQVLYVEDNGFQELLKPLYSDFQQQHPEYPKLRVHGIHQTANKVERIASLEPYISNGHLLFSTDLSSVFIQQMILFPTDYDDGPDALHGAVSQLKQHNTLGFSSVAVPTHGYQRNKSFRRRR